MEPGVKNANIYTETLFYIFGVFVTYRYEIGR